MGRNGREGGVSQGKEAVGMEEENNKDRKVIQSFSYHIVPNSNSPLKNLPVSCLLLVAFRFCSLPSPDKSSHCFQTIKEKKYS